MTKPLTYCRKRCRSNCEEEIGEFMPLSKRINNLHINNTLLTTASVSVDSHHANCQDSINNLCHVAGEHQPLGTVDMTQWNGLLNHEMSAINHNAVNQRVNGGGNEERCNNHNQIQEPPPLPYYNPDLTESDNPYYFENNRLLFSLYMERLQRTASSNQL